MRLIRLGIVMALLSLLVSTAAGCQPQFQPGTFTDDIGRQVNIDKVPQRIVSHVPSITETLFALGLEEKIVGVSDYCNYPPEAKLKPSVGNYFNPSIERIVALNPDLVLTDGHSESIIQLEGLGINFIVLQPEDIDDIMKNIELLGKVTGSESKAKEIINDMEEGISKVLAQVEGAPRSKVFYTFDATDLTNPWTAGPGSFVHSLISMAGGENIAAKAMGAWVQFSLEEVVASDPEIVIIDARIAPAKLREHHIWRQITAIKQNRIFTVDGDLVNRPGPRIIQGLEEMARIIHPELF